MYMIMLNYRKDFRHILIMLTAMDWHLHAERRDGRLGA
jgi:hypothetical protein